MKKDEKLEQTLDQYFEGVESPNVDLSAAKREIRARRRRLKGLKWQIPAFAAVLMAAVLAASFFLPSLSLKKYSIADAKVQYLSYSDLNDSYEPYLHGLKRFAYARNASAQYSLYQIDGVDVLLKADVSMINGFNRLQATVFTDLTAGEYSAEEFNGYPELKNSAYRYERQDLNGEQVYRATYRKGDTNYYIDCMTSGDSKFFDWFINLF